MRTINTVGAIDRSSIPSSFALVANISLAQSNTVGYSTSSFQFEFYAIGIVLTTMPPFVYLYWRQRRTFYRQLAEQAEHQRLERDRIELETLRRTGAVVDEVELVKLKIKKVADLELETLDTQEENTTVSDSSVQMSVKKNFKIRNFFPKNRIHLNSSEAGEPSMNKTTNSSCRICLEPLKESDEYRQLYCSHIFHVGCIDVWLSKRSRYCPLCRIDVIQGVHEDEVEQEATDRNP
ncbi:hypothetical protein HK096_009557, partial [Nowakowskiella sp. JEL0078]